LWPRSRTARPKPFLPLVGEETLFQQALRRTRDRILFAAPMIVTGHDHLDFVERQSGDSDTAILVEPCARNTAAAIALAAHRLARDRVMLVCPSDHLAGRFRYPREPSRNRLRLYQARRACGARPSGR
jgi:mannose-1-phosphate guanylyltransferase